MRSELGTARCQGAAFTPVATERFRRRAGEGPCLDLGNPIPYMQGGSPLAAGRGPQGV